MNETKSNKCCDRMREAMLPYGMIDWDENKKQFIYIKGEYYEIDFQYCPWCGTKLSPPAEETKDKED